MSLTQLIGERFLHLADHAEHHVQVVRQRPRLHRLEHVVVEHVVLGVLPVVGDLRGRVVPHHVRGAGPGAGRVVGLVAGRPGRVPLLDEPVHLAAVHVGHRVVLAVRPAAVAVRPVVVGPGAAAARVGHAHRGLPVLHGDAVRAGIRAEVGVERAVLLHDDDHVLDLVDPRGNHIMAGRAARDLLDRRRLVLLGCAAGRAGWPDEVHAASRPAMSRPAPAAYQDLTRTRLVPIPSLS